jgi:hypothetical protein
MTDTATHRVDLTADQQARAGRHTALRAQLAAGTTGSGLLAVAAHAAVVALEALHVADPATWRCVMDQLTEGETQGDRSLQRPGS